jgi:hypothetical protein
MLFSWKSESKKVYSFNFKGFSRFDSELRNQSKQSRQWPWKWEQRLVFELCGLFLLLAVPWVVIKYWNWLISEWNRLQNQILQQKKKTSCQIKEYPWE